MCGFLSVAGLFSDTGAASDGLIEQPGMKVLGMKVGGWAGGEGEVRRGKVGVRYRLREGQAIEEWIRRMNYRYLGPQTWTFVIPHGRRKEATEEEQQTKLEETDLHHTNSIV